MKWKSLSFFVNPFGRIAGGKALTWGVIGMILSIFLCYFSGGHYHGLLHFGPASNPYLWCYAVEHLVVWMIPSVLFYFSGRFFSTSRIRVIDVFGTVSFAQLPLLVINLLNFMPSMQKMLKASDAEMLEMSQQFSLTVVMLFSVLLLIWVCVLMYNALRVSCNLKGYKLGILFWVSLLLGEVLSRYLIALCY